MIAGAAACRGIQIEDNLSAALLHHLIEKMAQIVFRLLGRNLQAVDLEHLDSILMVKTENCLCIFLPVLKVILHTWVEP